jgi:hypothetical protein
MATGALVGAAMAVDEAPEAMELRADLAELAALLAAAPPDPVAVEATLSRLEATEEASLRTEETADSAPLAAEPVAEERAEPAAEVMEERTEVISPAAEVAPPTMDVTSPATEERTDWTWAEARPAPATRAMVEKRMLMDVFGGWLVGWVGEGVMRTIGFERWWMKNGMGSSKTMGSYIHRTAWS